MNCKDCRWWSNEIGQYDYDAIVFPEDPETMARIPQELLEFEVRRCVQPKLIVFQRPEHADGLSVCDGSQYKANLYTAPNFGCVNFAPQDKECPPNPPRSN